MACSSTSLTAAFPTDDPTALWPADRPQVKLGRLEVVGVRRPPSGYDRR